MIVTGAGDSDVFNIGSVRRYFLHVLQQLNQLRRFTAGYLITVAAATAYFSDEIGPAQYSQVIGKVALRNIKVLLNFRIRCAPPDEIDHDRQPYRVGNSGSNAVNVQIVHTITKV